MTRPFVCWPLFRAGSATTGEMVAIEPGERKGHRDGMLSLDAKYMNAAFEAGLGGSDGMYGHMKGLTKVGGGTVPGVTSTGGSGKGPSMTASLHEGSRSGKSFIVSTGHGRKLSDTKTAPEKPWAQGSSARKRFGKNKGTVTVATPARGGVIKQVTQGRSRSISTSTGSGLARAGGEAVSFNRFKGVVNTMGGTEDYARRQREAASGGAGGRVSGSSSGGRGVMATSTKKGGTVAKLHTTADHAGFKNGMVTGGVSVVAPKRRGFKTKTSSGSGASSGSSSGGGTVGGSSTQGGGGRVLGGRSLGGSGSSSTASTSKSGGRAVATGKSKAKTGSAPRKGKTSSTHVLGGKAATASKENAADLRAKRAAFFDKKFGSGAASNPATVT